MGEGVPPSLDSWGTPIRLDGVPPDPPSLFRDGAAPPVGLDGSTHCHGAMIRMKVESLCCRRGLLAYVYNGVSLTTSITEVP